MTLFDLDRQVELDCQVLYEALYVLEVVDLLDTQAEGRSGAMWSDKSNISILLLP